jgi:tetratricopeptide (TPR) repeat protein
MDAFLRGFPAPVEAPSNALVPTSPEVFWDLVRASALRLRNEGLAEATALAERVTQQDPTCATGWLLLGNLHYRQTLNNPSAFRRERAETEALFQRSLERAPHHPRAVFLLALIYSDAGNHREALDLLVAARKHQPANPTLLTGFAYAGRGAGLLPLSRRAMDLRDGLALAQFTPQALDITCLYTGEVDRFEASLREQPGHLRSTGGVLPFYRGYLALLRGQGALAHEEFHRAAALTHGYPNMQRLSAIYDLILEGRKDEALQAVKAFDQERVGLQEPDGEFTIRLAEAYALIGDRGTAMEMCARAFARGFGCTEWYERSPLLAPLRDLPRWKSLIQHLKERQVLMQERFPLSVLDA